MTESATLDNNTVAVAGSQLESLPSIDARIRKTFSVLRRVAKGMIAGHLNAAIVAGAPGVGKTYTLERELRAAEDEGLIAYQSVKGSMSAVGLYKQLWECREPGSILLLDDTDSVFSDMDSLNLLKASLDTGKSRRVHWNKESKVLDAEGIDRAFDFEGGVVFITNINFMREINRGVKMSAHYEALVSRSLYVDLGIHSKREVLVRIGQVVFSREFLDNNGLTRSEAQEMLEWLAANLARVRTLSIRTILQLVSLVKTDGHWRDMAECLILHQ